jgi:hypothetical protein
VKNNTHTHTPRLFLKAFAGLRKVVAREITLIL